MLKNVGMVAVYQCVSGKFTTQNSIITYSTAKDWIA